MATVTFNPTGSGQEWDVPPGLGEAYVELWGAEGAGGRAGLGGRVAGFLNLTGGETLYVYPGQSGANGGHPGGGSSADNPGGGYSAIRQGGDTHGDSAVVAAGGGGEGPVRGETNHDGGDGGADTGEDGEGGTHPSQSQISASGGGGATQSAGGSGGGASADNDGDADAGSDGSFGQGGAGGLSNDGDGDTGGGGGGGGHYGGGGGGAADYGGNTNYVAGGGGGGSNYDGGLATVDANVRGVQSGDGLVEITYIDLTLTVVSGDQIDLSWGDVDLGETNYEILRAESSGSSAVDYTTIDTVGADVTSYSDDDGGSGLEDGEEYFYRVRAIDGGGEVLLGQEQSATTDLPAPTIDTIDNSVEDELTVEWTKNDDSSDGEFELFRSQDGSLGSKVADGIGVGETSHTDTGLDDGTEYHYTLRRVTDHASTDSTQASATTNPPAPSDLSVDDTDVKEATLSWTDNSDSESAFQLFISTDGGGSYTQHGSDLAAGTTSTTATDLPTGRITFKVRAVMPDATADSGPITETIPGHAPAASGWYVEVDAKSGYTHRATAIEGGGLQPQRNPKANDRPSVRIPVEQNDKWDAINDPDEDVDMRVWQDGVRQPIDTLEDVEQRPGATILVGKGGRELGQRVVANRSQQAVHEFVDDLVTGETGYTANVDTPPDSTETNQPLDSWTDDGEFSSRFDPPQGDTAPTEVSGGAVNLLQSCFLAEGEDRDSGSGVSAIPRSGHSGGQTLEAGDVGDSAEWNFSLGYTIPAEDFDLRVRDVDNGNGIPGFTWYLDHANGNTYTIGGADGSEGATLTLSWSTIGSTYDGPGYTGPDLGPGDYTIRLEIDSNSAGNYGYLVDVLAPNDSRFSYTFDNTTDGNDALDGPELYPDEWTVSYREISAPQAVTGARAELTVNEGATPSNAFAIRLSNNQGASFAEATNVDTFETDDPGDPGADFGPSVILEHDLSRYGTQSSTPTQGINGHSVSAVTLEADFSNVPIVRNRTEDGHLDDILRNLANVADAFWAVEWDAEAETFSVEWTSPGQRTSDNAPEITDYRATKSTASVYQKAAVYGRSDIPVSGEQFTTDHGTAVELANDRIQPRTERVVDPDTGERFRRSVDYTMDDQDGTITALAAGGLDDGSVYEISYNYQAFGEYDDGTSNPAEAPPAEIPGLVSDFLCKQAARLIVDEVSEPLHTAEVVLPNDETEWSVVESVDPDIVPTGGNALHVRGVENTPEGTILTLGSRRSFSDVVDDIRAQVGAISRKA